MSNIYKDINQEIQGDLQEIEQQLFTFRRLVRQTKNPKCKLNREELQEIISGLTKETEALQCSIRLYRNILPKRKELLRNRVNEEL